MLLMIVSVVFFLFFSSRERAFFCPLSFQEHNAESDRFSETPQSNLFSSRFIHEHTVVFCTTTREP